MSADTFDAPHAEVPAASLDAFGDAELCAAAVEPIVLAVRAKHPNVKRAVHERLSPPRQALFAFWVAYGHARTEGWSRLFVEVPYLAEFPGFFADLRQACAYFGCSEMASLTGEAEALFQQPIGDASERVELWAELDVRYRQLAPGCLDKVAESIRRDPRSYFTELRPSP
jgi:hypothetical protein